MHRKYDRRSAGDCSRCMNPSARRNGSGLRMLLAYGNARLPQATAGGGRSVFGRSHDLGRAGIAGLADGTQRCETNGHFVPIGSQGFYHQDGDKARFDQQPLEAAGAVSACLQAYRVLETAAGAARPGRLSTGSWATTICNFLFTIPRRAVAETACIPTAPMRTRARSRRYRS